MLAVSMPIARIFRLATIQRRRRDAGRGNADCERLITPHRGAQVSPRSGQRVEQEPAAQDDRIHRNLAMFLLEALERRPSSPGSPPRVRWLALRR